MQKRGQDQDGQRVRTIAWIVSIGIVYFIAGRLSSALMFQPQGIAAIWPPSGIFLASVLLTRPKVRPYLIAVLFLTDMGVELLAGTPLNLSMVYALALTIDASLGAWLLTRFVGETITFRKVNEVTGFIVLCVILSNGVASLVAAAAPAWFLGVPFWTSFGWWWSADAAGTLLVTPLIMGVAAEIRIKPNRWNPMRIAEAIGLYVAMGLVNYFILSRFAGYNQSLLLLNYITFPFLIWSGMRFGVIGVTSSSILLTANALYFAISGRISPLAVDSALGLILAIQLSVAIISITSLYFAAIVTHRKETEKALSESEGRYRQLFEVSPDALFILDATGHFLDVNKAAEARYGYSREELLTMSAVDLAAPVLREQVKAKVKESLETNRRFEWRHRTKQGADLAAEIGTAKIIIDGKERILSSVRDITDRKRAEENLSRSNERITLATRAAAMGIWDWDIVNNKLVWDDKMYALYGIDEDLFSGAYEAWVNGLHPDDAVPSTQETQKALSGEKEYDTQFRVVWPDGTVRYLQANADVIRDADGKPIRMVGINYDITERVQIEKALRESEAQFRSVFKSSPVPISIYKSDGQILDANPAYLELTGYSRQETIGSSSVNQKLLSDETRQHVIDVMKANGGSLRNLEVDLRVRDGATRTVLLSGDDILIQGVPHRLGVNVDITERKQAERALHESEARFQQAFHASPIGINLFRLSDGRSIDVNAAFLELTGYPREEFVGHSAAELNLFVDTTARSVWMKKLSEGRQVRNQETEIRRKSGETRDVLASIETTKINDELVALVIANDITERKRAEQKLRQTEALFANAFHVGPAAMTITRISDGKFIDVNNSFLELFGYSREEAIEHTSLELNMLTPEGRRVLIQKQVEAGGLRNAELLAQTRSGRLITLLFSSRPMQLDGEACHLTTLIDITERKKSERALQESEERLRLSTELANVAVWEFNFLDNTMSRSKNHDALYGLEWQSIWRFETFLNATHPDDRDYSNQIIQNSAAPGGPDTYEFDFRVIYPDSSIHWLFVIGQIVERDAEGHGTIARGSLIDVTDRKQAEEALVRSEQMMRLFVEYSPASIAMFDHQMKYVVVSRRFLVDYGLGDQNLIGRSHYEVFPEIDERWKEIHRRCLAGAVEKCDKDPFLRADGTLNWVRWEIRPWEDSAGGTRGIILFSEVITERVQADEQIIRQSEELASLYALGRAVNQTLSAEEVMYTSIQETLRTVQPDLAFIILQEENAPRLTAFGPPTWGEVVEGTPAYQVSKAIADQVLKQAAPLYSQAIDRDFPVLADAGTHTGLRSIAAFPLRTGDEIIGVIGLSFAEERDLARQAEFLETLSSQIAISLSNALLYKRVQEYVVHLEARVAERTAELSIARDHAEAADRLKSSFLATMSHELRTPLNSIIGFTGIILQGLVGPLNVEQDKQLHMVQASARHLLDLINDILDLSKIEADQIQLDHEPFDLSQVIRSGAGKIAPLAAQKNLGLTVNIAPQVGAMVGDRRRVEQIVLNLLGNAVKFTDHGTITVAADLVPAMDGRPSVVLVQVKDTGIGIRAEDLTALFVPFQQVDGGITRIYEGTGLGLSICKRLVEMMGGKIWAESEWGVGSIFSFTLPYLESIVRSDPSVKRW